MRASIITIVRNAEHYVERTIQSVLAQTHTDIEYIVIDGASTDGTLARINRFRNRISVIISEPDSGISDAWNKGIDLANGQVIGLLNAGDEYYPDSVDQAIRALTAGADFVFGDTELIDDEGNVLRLNRGNFSLWYYSAGFGFYHPSCFATKSLYKKIGGFNGKLKYAMDSDWIARAAMSGARIVHSGAKAKMVDGGVSVTSRFLAYGEHLQALHNVGYGKRIIYGSMLMTGLRGLCSAIIKGRNVK